jgi:acyl transferase domain-containing protein
MHGTGTSLGDPIEVGALAALKTGSKQLGTAAAAPQSPAPMLLTASKSLVGHSEPAAGMMGMAHAVMVVIQQAALPLLHLATVNRYVTPAMQGGSWSLPRQLGGLASHPTIVSGISSFAFQGTNAHTIVQVAGIVHSGAVCHCLPWLTGAVMQT